MADNTDPNLNPNRNLSYSAYQGALAEIFSCADEKAREAAIKKSSGALSAGNAMLREIGREGLPMYAKATARAAENKYYDKVRAVRDATLTGVAGYALYKGGKFAYEFLKK